MAGRPFRGQICAVSRAWRRASGYGLRAHAWLRRLSTAHWVAGVDDGAQSLRRQPRPAARPSKRGRLRPRSSATPHMRPGMFDNTGCRAARGLRPPPSPRCRRRHPRERRAHPAGADALASEHFFDDIVFQRLAAGGDPSLCRLPREQGRARRAPDHARFPARIDHRFFDLMRRGLRPVIAHPERYEPVWDDPAVLEPLARRRRRAACSTSRRSRESYGRAPRAQRGGAARGAATTTRPAATPTRPQRRGRRGRQGIDLLFARRGREEASFC
jgi:protein-tyrosine phosphatase